LLNSPPNFKYDWRPSLPDTRDHIFQPKTLASGLPEAVNLGANNKWPPIFDQGQEGSCTGNASSAALAFEHGGGPYSRQFIYYNGRVFTGDVGQDGGSTPRDVLKGLAAYGAPLESFEQYNIADVLKKPTAADYAAAVPQKISQYMAVNQGNYAMRSCLAAGRPFIIGFTVYDSFESAQVAASGIVPMPKAGEQVLGGHCVVVLGYRWYNNQWYYLCANSWGTSWGLNGFFWMPSTYLKDANLAGDFWAIVK